MNASPIGGVLVIAGPTASGKSGLALRIAAEFGGTIINADSMQVYRDLRVLTARPTVADEKQVPHMLYGMLPASEVCSAGRWAELAEAAISEVRAVGRLPIVVGGTGLYLKALIDGLDDIPAIPDAVRQSARDLHDRLGTASFHTALSARDPVMGARLNPTDRQRLIRAYEVIEATGRSLADWQSEGDGSDARRRQFGVISILTARDKLYAACDARVGRMIEQGAVSEVDELLSQRLDPALPAMKALGVAQLSAYLREELSLDEAVSATQKATRNFAKRQSTWFRHQLSADLELTEPLVDAQLSNKKLEKIFSFIRKTCLTTQ